ncbi:MAG TPA: FecR domain-containing protein [Hanamia sp.]|nr:FecR domain-containing protein [Hanamia sp.]
MDESEIWNLMAKKMAGEATGEELSKLEAVFKANPDMEYAFSIINGITNPSLHEPAFSREEDKLLEKKLSEIDQTLSSKKTKARVITFRKSFWAAASLLLIVGCSFLYYFLTKTNNTVKTVAVMPKDHKAFVADSPTTITLQDGSKVWLNSGSTLNCAPDFGKKYREVKLSGEAYFEVTHNAEKPFIVEAGSFMKVKVLGTTFNVKAYPDDPYIEASLITGKITINLDDESRAPIILKPHEKATFWVKDSVKSETAVQKKIKIPVSWQINSIKPNPVDQHISELSWMRGELAFNDIPFEELAYDLERAYHISIEFKNEQLKDYHLTGVFKGENLNEVLQALQVTTPFKYEIAGQKVSIYK